MRIYRYLGPCCRVSWISRPNYAVPLLWLLAGRKRCCTADCGCRGGDIRTYIHMMTMMQNHRNFRFLILRNGRGCFWKVDKWRILAAPLAPLVREGRGTKKSALNLLWMNLWRGWLWFRTRGCGRHVTVRGDDKIASKRFVFVTAADEAVGISRLVPRCNTWARSRWAFISHRFQHFHIKQFWAVEEL